ncbi:hypothetical protein J3R30DRAFT_3402705 [Lentinula aciculospora]|uniref:Carbohydrate-binding module family 50 protein n=1 Tax=Lentinula aciculospora TaxID=153920 RepID=A0A9W9AGE5_9AGAR|nr:hypothetical protein J3R30DRAFT_3402705 [Lentinula aciculospora]
MGRWTQYDEDAYRLPDGFRRVGYDADTGQYTYEDKSGCTWNGAPYQKYGVMHRASPHLPTSAIPRNLAERIRSFSASASRHLGHIQVREQKEPAPPERTIQKSKGSGYSRESPVKRSVSVDTPSKGNLTNLRTTRRSPKVNENAIGQSTPSATALRPSNTISHHKQHASASNAQHTSSPEVKLPLKKSATLPSRHSKKPESDLPALPVTSRTLPLDEKLLSMASVHPPEQPPPVPPKEFPPRRRVTSPRLASSPATERSSELTGTLQHSSSLVSKPKLNSGHESTASIPRTRRGKPDTHAQSLSRYAGTGEERQNEFFRWKFCTSKGDPQLTETSPE